VSSWFFGDGSVLFDQAATSVSANPVAMTAPFAARIAALDPVLGRAMAAWQNGGSMGARISRALTPRLTAEFGIDVGFARLRPTGDNADAIEATAASFSDAFRGFILANPSRVMKSVTSSAALERGDARQLLTSAALLVNLRTGGRLIPYAAVGASLISVTGDRPSARLHGNYQFSNMSGAQFDESDDVAVVAVSDGLSVGGLLGGGVKYYVSSRWGVRLDVRVSLTKDERATALTATPTVVVGSQPAGRLTLNAEPTIQFGNSTGTVTSLGVTGLAPSSLSGPALDGLRTFSGSGVAPRTSVTAGVFWRF
jgi:hypothetical protein